MNTQQTINELEALLSTLKDKELAGSATPGSYEKGLDLVRWHKSGKPLSERQLTFVYALIERARRRTGHYRPDAKLTVLVSRNPKRFGSVQHQRFEQLLTFNDKTVGEFAAAGGMHTTLHHAVAIKAVKVTVDGVEINEDGGDVQTPIVAQSALAPQQPIVDTQQIIDAVTPRVIEALERRAPREVKVVVQQADGRTHEVKGAKHCQFEHLLKAAVTRLPNGYAPNIFLQGEASSGKTTGTRMLSDALKTDWYFNGAISMPHEMLGFIDAGGKYHRTPFRDAYEHGGVYTFDEVDRSDPVALLAVNPHLANGIATFPDKQIKRHKSCVIVATANTWGLGADAHYSGATKLDAAFLSRFPIRINWDIDPLLEEIIVPNGAWLDRVRSARERARAVGLKVMIDTRIAQAGASLIESGYSMDDAAKMTYLANLKAEQRQILEG